MTTIDNAAIAKQLGLSKEEMIARFGEPGTKTPEEIGSALGMDHDAIIKAFGEKNSTDSGDVFELTDKGLTENIDEDADEDEGITAYVDADGDVVEDKEDADDDNVDAGQKTKDDKYKEVADAIGYDRKSVSAVMKAIENGDVSGRPEEVVPKLAKELGLTEKLVSAVLSYLNNGQI